MPKPLSRPLVPKGVCVCGHDGVDHHPHNSDPPNFRCLVPGCPCRGFEKLPYRVEVRFVVAVSDTDALDRKEEALIAYACDLGFHFEGATSELMKREDVIADSPLARDLEGKQSLLSELSELPGTNTWEPES